MNFQNIDDKFDKQAFDFKIYIYIPSVGIFQSIINLPSNRSIVHTKQISNIEIDVPSTFY